MITGVGHRVVKGSKMVPGMKRISVGVNCGPCGPSTRSPGVTKDFLKQRTYVIHKHWTTWNQGWADLTNAQAVKIWMQGWAMQTSENPGSQPLLWTGATSAIVCWLAIRGRAGFCSLKHGWEDVTTSVAVASSHACCAKNDGRRADLISLEVKLRIINPRRYWSFRHL